jgi:hypothetical protein
MPVDNRHVGVVPIAASFFVGTNQQDCFVAGCKGIGKRKRCTALMALLHTPEKSQSPGSTSEYN